MNNYVIATGTGCYEAIEYLKSLGSELYCVTVDPDCDAIFSYMYQVDSIGNKHSVGDSIITMSLSEVSDIIMFDDTIKLDDRTKFTKCERSIYYYNKLDGKRCKIYIMVVW